MVTGGVRWERVLPGVARLRHYDRAWLRGDLLAGITVAAYLVPQVMAYAVIAGLPPVAGLWACLAPFLVYALFGSSGQLSVGPESTTAVMTAAGVASLVGLAGPGRYAEAASLLAVAVGVICLIGYAGRLGFLAELLSKPVLVGYMAGVALLMIASQFGKLLKLTLSATEPIDEFGEAVTRLGEAHGPTVLLSIAVIAALFAMGRWRPRWPGPLNAILIASAAVAAFDLDRYGITTIGPVPAGLPALRVPDFAGLSLPTVFAAALGVAIVGYSDNVLTARAFAAKRNEHIDSNQEFLALGLANITAGLSSGFPVSSSGSRTVIGDAMGSRTQLHSLVALLGVLVTMFFLGPVLASFPSAALGGVVVYAALRLIDVSEWRRIIAFRRSELALAIVTCGSVIGLGVLPGIGIAIALSILDLLRRLAKPHDGILGYVPGVAGMHDIDDYRNAQQVPGLIVYRYDSPLFFANAENFVTRALRSVDQAPTPTEWFLLNAEANVEVDLTAVDALDHLRATLEDRGIEFAMARVKQELRNQLAAAGFVDKVGEDRIFPTLPSAVSAYALVYWTRHGVSLADLGVRVPPTL